MAPVQTLESRTLMSASTASVTPAITADRLAVRADLLHFRADALAGTATLIRDVARLKADHLSAATTVVPLVTQLRADVKQMSLALRGDRLTQQQAVLTDELTIVTELKQALADRANPTALAADRSQLRTDRAKLQADEVAGLNARIATRTAAATTIFSDVQAIEVAAASDPNATPALKAAVVQFGSDRTAKLATQTADLAKLATDRQQLSADLTAAAAA